MTAHYHCRDLSVLYCSSGKSCRDNKQQVLSRAKIRLFSVFVEGSCFISQTLVDNFITTNGRQLNRCCGVATSFRWIMQGNLQFCSSFHTGDFRMSMFSFLLACISLTSNSTWEWWHKELLWFFWCETMVMIRFSISGLPWFLLFGHSYALLKSVNL